MKRFIVILATVCSIMPAAFSAKGVEGEELLTNQSVIELKNLGLGESIIIQKIKTTAGKFDLTVGGLKMLKAANVPEPVIAAMFSRVELGNARETLIVPS